MNWNELKWTEINRNKLVSTVHSGLGLQVSDLSPEIRGLPPKIRGLFWNIRASRQKPGAFFEKSGPPAKNPGPFLKHPGHPPKIRGFPKIRNLKDPCFWNHCAPKHPPPFQYQRKSRKGLGVPIAKKTTCDFFVLPPCNKNQKRGGLSQLHPSKNETSGMQPPRNLQFLGGNQLESAGISRNQQESAGITWNKLKETEINWGKLK